MIKVTAEKPQTHLGQYSFQMFNKEFDLLTTRIVNLSKKMMKTSPATKKNLEGSLDQLNIQQLNLAGRVKQLSKSDLEKAAPMMEKMDKILAGLDTMMYKKTVQSWRDGIRKLLIGGFIDGLIVGTINGIVDSVVSDLTTTPSQLAEIDPTDCNPLSSATVMHHEVIPDAVRDKMEQQLTIHTSSNVPMEATEITAPASELTYAQYQESLIAGYYAELEAGAIDNAVPEFLREYGYDSAGMEWGEGKPIFREIYVDPALPHADRAGQYGVNALKLLRHAGNEYGHGNAGNAIGTIGDAAIQAGHSVSEVIKAYLEVADNMPPHGGTIILPTLGEK